MCVLAAVVGESGGRALRLPVTSTPSLSCDGADGRRRHLLSGAAGAAGQMQ